ncbi:hypothetical protein F2P81_021819 [Scophthalmus maximus]|uniref:Uncharacterized protein n=1 Tax=Scophthalmus maximus TaxID=52904 RepID=A0A6A4RYE3_SCOMX|nr:hypothetical protein F2P81_021819 [Scophthalmus maximus]
MVKSPLVHLLSEALRIFRKESCFGCVVDHLSQNQHECLENASDYYYMTNFHEVNKRLLPDRFIPAVQKTLEAYQIKVSDCSVLGLTEAFLRCERRIGEKTLHVFFKLTGGEVLKIKILRKSAEFWLEG